MHLTSLTLLSYLSDRWHEMKLFPPNLASFDHVLSCNWIGSQFFSHLLLMMYWLHILPLPSSNNVGSISPHGGHLVNTGWARPGSSSISQWLMRCYWCRTMLIANQLPAQIDSVNLLQVIILHRHAVCLFRSNCLSVFSLFLTIISHLSLLLCIGTSFSYFC